MKLNNIKEAFRAMDTKTKIDYIWEYYKAHIIGAVVVVGLVIYLIIQMTKPPLPTYSAELVVGGKLDIAYDVIEQTKLELDATMDFGVTEILEDWSMVSPSTMMNDQLMVLKLKTKECDVLAVPSIKYQNYLNIEDYDAFMPLEEIPELSEVLVRYEDSLMKSKSTVDGKEHVYGIQVESLANLEGITLAEPLIVSMVKPPKDVDAAIALMQYILE